MNGSSRAINTQWRNADIESHRVLGAYCKANRELRENKVYLLRAPHMLDIRRILRALSRIRAE